MIERLAGPAGCNCRDAVASILAQAFSAPEQRWSVESVAGTLAAPGTVAFLAPDPAVPQGCALLRVVADEAELLTLAVLPAARRQGLARRLVAACLDEAAAAGVVRVHLEVGASNAVARALYAGAGFIEIGRRPGYYRGAAGREDAVLMARDTGPAPRPGAGRSGRGRIHPLPVPAPGARNAGRRRDPMTAKTLYDKIWDAHVVHEAEDGTCLLYIDWHLVHEVTSPQAFEGLRLAGRRVRAPQATVAVPDHNIATTADRLNHILDEESRIQVEALRTNCREFGVELYDIDDIRQGIVHIIGPEQGITQPGTTIVCGDSHTATHGAFGALAHGIGTSEVEHVLATQTLVQKKSRNMKVEVTGSLPPGVSAKDITLTVIGKTGTAGGTGHVIEYCGEAIRSLSMEGRMTVCNMAIEGGARAGLIAPDETTFAYLKGRPRAPQGDMWDKAVAYWRGLRSDEGAHYDKVVTLDASEIVPVVTWGTSPEDVLPITGRVPDPSAIADPGRKAAASRSLKYMGLTPGTPLAEIAIDTVFIGSCTNGRIEDLREVAKVMEGRRVKEGLRAMIVPGSGLVRKQAEDEGLLQKLVEAGFDFRLAGCSMCLGMNPDQLSAGERCASTSNRNFEGRQGRGGRTHLVSPAMAAAAAVTGRLTDVREL